MTAAEKKQKNAWFLFMIGYFALGYALISRVSQARSSFMDVSFGFEAAIPFLPQFIFGYLLVFLSVFLAYLMIDDMRAWMRAVLSFLISTTLAYIIFLAVPVRMELRPVVVEASGLAGWATRLYFAIDPPYNCFPSLHVTYPVLAAIAMWTGHRRARWLFLTMALAVSASVVLVKQHYIADVVAGAANATLSYWLAVAYERVASIQKAISEPISGGAG